VSAAPVSVGALMLKVPALGQEPWAGAILSGLLGVWAFVIVRFTLFWTFPNPR
jgi:hypothetical protein